MTCGEGHGAAAPGCPLQSRPCDGSGGGGRPGQTPETTTTTGRRKKEEDMKTQTNIEIIAALAGHFGLADSDSGCVAIHVIDGILKNGITPAPEAVRAYASTAFLADEGYEASEIDWKGVRSAVGEALRVLQSPVGVVLVNASTNLLAAEGADLAAVQAAVCPTGRNVWTEAASWAELDAADPDEVAGCYVAYTAPLAGWEILEAWRVKKIASAARYWTVDWYACDENEAA
jgi:hypothetical protein